MRADSRPLEHPFLFPDILAWIAAVLAATAAAGGLVLTGLYRDPADLVLLFRANDAFVLFVAFPVAVLSLWAAARGVLIGRLIAVGMLFSLAYVYGNLAFSAEINVLTVTHVAILALSFWSALLMLRRIDASAVHDAVEGRLLRVPSALLLFAMSAITVAHWFREIYNAVMQGGPSDDLIRFGWVTNPLIAIELTFVLPLSVAAGILFLRRDALGDLLGVPLLSLFALLGAGLLITPFAFAVFGQPFDTTLAVIGAVFFALPAILITLLMVPHGGGDAREHLDQALRAH